MEILEFLEKGTICQEVSQNAAKVKALLVPTRGYQMWLLDCWNQSVRNMYLTQSAMQIYGLWRPM